MLSLALLAPLALSPGALPSSQDAAPQVTAESLTADLDRAEAWLRAQQGDDGGFGGAFATAWALRAFLADPATSTVADAPYLSAAVASLADRQRDDGSIRDSEDDEVRATATTLAVLAALSGEPEEPALSICRGARRYLGLESVVFAGPPRPAPDAAREFAAALLERRADDGSWGGSVVATARNAWLLRGCAAALGAGGPAGAEPLPTFAAADRERAAQALERGATFLAESANSEGLWGDGDETVPGVTAFVTSALLAVPEPRPDAVQAAAERGLAYLRHLQNEDGSIHAGSLQNYVTSASIQALVRGGAAQDEPRIERARAYLARLQADEDDGYGPEHVYYGGIGYDSRDRPDMSNLQIALEALAASGTEPGDEAFEKALVFLQRSQNRSESNDATVQRDGTTRESGDDGGGVYQPGDSKAGFVTLPDGKLVPRSYGSMTYALLRGYLFAGLDRDDPRVQAAWDWIREHFTLDVNPGFEASNDPAAPYQGLFYYFYSMSRALDLYGQEVVTDGAGVEHRWREALAGRLASMQRPDGSWVNENSPRWWEGNPVLASAYGVLSLEATLDVGD